MKKYLLIIPFSSLLQLIFGTTYPVLELTESTSITDTLFMSPGSGHVSSSNGNIGGTVGWPVQAYLNPPNYSSADTSTYFWRTNYLSWKPSINLTSGTSGIDTITGNFTIDFFLNDAGTSHAAADMDLYIVSNGASTSYSSNTGSGQGWKEVSFSDVKIPEDLDSIYFIPNTAGYAMGATFNVPIPTVDPSTYSSPTFHEYQTVPDTLYITPGSDHVKSTNQALGNAVGWPVNLGTNPVSVSTSDTSTYFWNNGYVAWKPTIVANSGNGGNTINDTLVGNFTVYLYAFDHTNGELDLHIKGLEDIDQSYTESVSAGAGWKTITFSGIRVPELLDSIYIVPNTDNPFTGYYNVATFTRTSVVTNNTISINKVSHPEFNIFPNPINAGGELTVQSNTAIQSLDILDRSGKIVSSSTGNKIKTHHFQKGFFMLRLKDSNDRLTTTKIIIK